MKMRVVTATNKGKLLTLAERIAKKGESTYAVDVIPPAYQMDRERLVVIVATLNSNMPSSFRIFCSGLNRDRTSNVALVVDAPNAAKCADAVAEVKEAVVQAGAKFYENVLYIQGGLPFKFMKKTTPEEEAAVDAWTEELLASI